MSFFDYPTAEPAAIPTSVLLPDASEADWATLLEFTDAVRFSAGQRILAAGSGGRSLYLLLDGTLEVVTAPSRFGLQRRLGRLEAGSLVGEVSFFDGAPRSAEVRAVTTVVLAELTPQDFDRLGHEHPRLAISLLQDLGRILAGRLRDAEAGLGSAASEAP